MKLLGLFVFGADQRAPVAQALDLSPFGFFAKGAIREHMVFASRVVAERTESGSRQSVALDRDFPYTCHVYRRKDGRCGVCIADHEYPQRVAFTLLSHVLEHCGGTENERLSEYLARYQDPRAADPLTRIEHTLEEVKEVMHKNIGEVLRRGEKLEDLMDKAEDLSTTSVVFYKRAKQTNQCCKVY